MKKIVLIISILIISLSGCSLFSDEGSKDSTLTQKAEAIKKDLGNQIQRMDEHITKTYIVGLVGVFIGFVGLLIAISAYKKTRANTKQIKNPIFPNTIDNEPSNTTIKQEVSREIENYLYSKKFENRLKSILQTQTISNGPISGEPVSQEEPKMIPCELYAKESNSMQLSSIQNSYQKGKSIYKLILAEPNSNIAQISLCIEEEEAQKRILAYDDRYLKPICQVSRLSSQATTVEVKSPGTAEKIGGEWKVTKQVIVEIK